VCVEHYTMSHAPPTTQHHPERVVSRLGSELWLRASRQFGAHMSATPI
jgi:hypothetical protein